MSDYELFKLIESNNNETQCLDAIKKIYDIDGYGFLYKSALATKYKSVFLSAIERMEDFYVIKVLWNSIFSKDESVCLYVIDKINEEHFIENVVNITKHEYESVCLAAIKKISNELRISAIAESSKYESVWRAAIEKMKEDSFIYDLATISKYKSIRLAALNKITDSYYKKKLQKKIRISNESKTTNNSSDEYQLDNDDAIRIEQRIWSRWY